MDEHIMRPIKSGKGMRMSFAQHKEVLEMPNFIEVQKKSYDWFVTEGLQEVFDDIGTITDYGGRFSLKFTGFKLDKDGEGLTIPECKARDATYAACLYVTVRLYDKETGEPEEHSIFMGELPIMTDTGTFVINGAERVIVSQLVRSPGIYYGIDHDKIGKELYSCTVIPNRGAWLEYETDSNDIFYIKVDRQRKLPITTFLRAMGLGTNREILEVFGEEPKIVASFEKDPAINEKSPEGSEAEGLKELYKKLRPGEPVSEDSAETLITGMLFDPRRYDLAKVGRYKFNKKLALYNRIVNKVLAEDVIDTETGEIIAEKGTVLTKQMASDIQNAGVPFVWIKVDDKTLEQQKLEKVKVLSNMMVDIEKYVKCDPKKDFGLSEGLVYYPILKPILDKNLSKEDLFEEIKKNIKDLVPKHITKDDIFASVNYCMHLEYGIGTKDDIDHLGNRRIRAVGELLQNQYRIGLSRLERVIRERMSTQDTTGVGLEDLINKFINNIRPVTAAIKEFFGSSQLSQFMDQNNPLGELTHKRRLSALGPGGLSRDRAGFEVRDVHYTHYGRMCPIETPEGPNIGLINSLASYARINEYGFIEAPYRVVDRTDPENPRVTDKTVYMTADDEDDCYVAQASAKLDENGYFVTNTVSGRYRDQTSAFDKRLMEYMDVSPRMVFSVATALIPFLQNDDANRALMGANMQRQAVPLLKTEAPVIGTGMEEKTAVDSGVTIVAKRAGVVKRSESNRIIIKTDDGKEDVYDVQKFVRSNQSNCYNQRPIVFKGDRVEEGEVIADGPSTSGGELALGKNPLIGFMEWEGYNYEDAVLLSERLVKDDVYTSIHMEQFETDARTVKLGKEEITRDISNVGSDALKNLGEDGIIRVGAEVRAGDILVGKVTPKGETELTPEEKLLKAIFGDNAKEVRDTSLRVPHGEYGIVVDVKKFTRENKDKLPPGVNETVRVYIAQRRKISVGDKMAGRHGNKGVVSRILPVEDMPFLPNGRPLDICLNPLGVPSRMNIGQVLEIHFSLAAKVLGFNIETPVFDGANEEDIGNLLEMANDYVNTTWEEFENKYKDVVRPEVLEYLYNNRDHRKLWKGVQIGRDGKVQLRDGRTGENFYGRTTVGHMHYLKLHHLVDDKIHARSTGPYSLVTQQPLGGKAQFGGQRFGEMEVWALEAYGAAYTLQEILTVKSDDVVGRVKTYEAIIKGENIPNAGIPESFKVLLKELQALALDITLLDENGNEVKLKDASEYDKTNINSVLRDDKNYAFESDKVFAEHGFSEASYDAETGKENEIVDNNSEDDSLDSDEFMYQDEDYINDDEE